VRGGAGCRRVGESAGGCCVSGPCISSSTPAGCAPRWVGPAQNLPALHVPHRLILDGHLPVGHYASPCKKPQPTPTHHCSHHGAMSPQRNPPSFLSLTHGTRHVQPRGDAPRAGCLCLQPQRPAQDSPGAAAGLGWRSGTGGRWPRGCSAQPAVPVCHWGRAAHASGAAGAAHGRCEGCAVRLGLQVGAGRACLVPVLGACVLCALGSHWQSVMCLGLRGVFCCKQRGTYGLQRV
jgi:hypothetical protein